MFLLSSRPSLKYLASVFIKTCCFHFCHGLRKLLMFSVSRFFSKCLYYRIIRQKDGEPIFAVAKIPRRFELCVSGEYTLE